MELPSLGKRIDLVEKNMPEKEIVDSSTNDFKWVYKTLYLDPDTLSNQRQFWTGNGTVGRSSNGFGTLPRPICWSWRSRLSKLFKLLTSTCEYDPRRSGWYYKLLKGRMWIKWKSCFITLFGIVKFASDCATDCTKDLKKEMQYGRPWFGSFDFMSWKHPAKNGLKKPLTHKKL